MVRAVEWFESQVPSSNQAMAILATAVYHTEQKVKNPARLYLLRHKDHPGIPNNPIWIPALAGAIVVSDLLNRKRLAKID